MRSALLWICLAMLTNVQAAELYRSIDKDGNVHYSDSPLAGSEDVEKLKLDSEPVPDEDLPYETKVAMQNFPVTFYSFPDCGAACVDARELLSKRGIPFAEKSLVNKESIDAFNAASGNSPLPAATVGKTWLKGFLAEQWNNELDFAGYPKSVPPIYRPRPAASAVQPAQ